MPTHPQYSFSTRTAFHCKLMNMLIKQMIQSMIIMETVILHSPEQPMLIMYYHIKVHHLILGIAECYVR